MSNFGDLTADNLLEITDQLDDETLLTYCQTNKEIAKLCDDKVWLHRIFSNGLVSLLPYATLYPTLRDFYLNIRRDALYQLTIYYTEDGKSKVLDNYYTNVKNLYDAIKVPGETTSITVILKINNTRYNISYRNSYSNDNEFTSTPSFITSFEEILKFPNLVPRPLIMVEYYDSLDITSDNLRKLRSKNEPRYNPVFISIRDTGSEQDINMHFDSFKYGFLDSRTVARSKLIVLLDQSLVDVANNTSPIDNNYYVVIGPHPVQNSDRDRIYGGFSHSRSHGYIDYSSYLLEYVTEYGTYYKLEDLPTLLRLYK